MAHRLSKSFNSYLGSIWPKEHVVSECKLLLARWPESCTEFDLMVGSDHMLAGVDLPAITAAYLFYELATHPQVLSKLQAELDAHHAEGEEDAVQSLARLPYLNCIIKEST